MPNATDDYVPQFKDQAQTVVLSGVPTSNNDSNSGGGNSIPPHEPSVEAKRPRKTTGAGLDDNYVPQFKDQVGSVVVPGVFVKAPLSSPPNHGRETSDGSCCKSIRDEEPSTTGTMAIRQSDRDSALSSSDELSLPTQQVSARISVTTCNRSDAVSSSNAPQLSDQIQSTTDPVILPAPLTSSPVANNKLNSGEIASMDPCELSFKDQCRGPSPNSATVAQQSKTSHKPPTQEVYAQLINVVSDQEDPESPGKPLERTEKMTTSLQIENAKLKRHGLIVLGVTVIVLIIVAGAVVGVTTTGRSSGSDTSPQQLPAENISNPSPMESTGSNQLTLLPTVSPTVALTNPPSQRQTYGQDVEPAHLPTLRPTQSPTQLVATNAPTTIRTESPTRPPSPAPTFRPTPVPQPLLGPPPLPTGMRPSPTPPKGPSPLPPPPPPKQP